MCSAHLPCKTLFLLPNGVFQRLGTCVSAHLLAMSVGDLQVLSLLQLDGAALAARHPLDLSSKLQIAGHLHLQQTRYMSSNNCELHSIEGRRPLTAHPAAGRSVPAERLSRISGANTATVGLSGWHQGCSHCFADKSALKPGGGAPPMAHSQEHEQQPQQALLAAQFRSCRPAVSHLEWVRVAALVCVRVAASALHTLHCTYCSRRGRQLRAATCRSGPL